MGLRVTIVGGCGHVGIPLGLALANAGHNVSLLDINERAVDLINQGKLPFQEEGGAEVLSRVVGKALSATTDPEVIKSSQVVVFVTGTPVDEHLNPRVNDIISVLKIYMHYLTPETLVVLRSTVYPGVVEVVESLLTEALGSTLVAFCPERIVQGKGIVEIGSLPQIISGTSKKAEELAHDLFSSIVPKTILLSPREAEVAKLVTNSWRYLEFAIANQFFMMLEGQGLDFFRIFEALSDDYPRAQHFARPGLAAGPCLFKDTMQLSAFHQNQ
ncbi:MAG: nucleotide sugar dehydrogenase, partial [Bdellovibrionales bacterium]|nr:nucleotide sugar dehydrogenase [Bdellovibrionales bacterium]